jgi:apolipoprotein N-acyltransferase
VFLALAFPRAGLSWAAPLGAGALFWTWQRASWKRAAWCGWFCGLVFFTITFWWWSTTIATAVGTLAYVAVIVSAGIEALALAIAGMLTVLARARTAPWLLPLAGAAAYALTEWARSIGVLGVPFGQLGTTAVGTPLQALGAYVGTSGLTFVIVALGAYAADALARRTLRALIAFAVCLIALSTAAWAAWPARSAPAPRIPVAAIQGNIAQTLKWQPGALQHAVNVYTAMTVRAAARHPRLIVWPETVIAIYRGGLNENPELIGRFTHLAAQADATLVVGSIDVHNDGFYNALYLFTPAGVSGVYDKHQLVPFAEHFPGQQFLWWLPYIGSLNGGFAAGTGTGVFPTTAGLRIGPLICWESAFGDLAHHEVREGAQVLVVSTDDAWFGTSSGPYQHAEIAQMRAIESGEYVIRAAATGISGIIAPDGRWQQRVGLDQQRVIEGDVGLPVGSAFARIGPTRVWFGLLALYVLMLLVPRRRHET